MPAALIMCATHHVFHHSNETNETQEDIMKLAKSFVLIAILLMASAFFVSAQDDGLVV